MTWAKALFLMMLAGYIAVFWTGWLIFDALVRLQPTYSPLVSTFRVIVLGSEGQQTISLWPFILMATLTHASALSNFCISSSTKKIFLSLLKMLTLLVITSVAYVIFKLEFSFVNPSNPSDNEVKKIVWEGVALVVEYARGKETERVSLVPFFCFYAVYSFVLSYPFDLLRSKKKIRFT